MKRKSPGQIAFEAFYHDQPTEKWNGSRRWEAAAAAVIANQWRPVTEPPEDTTQIVLVCGGNHLPAVSGFEGLYVDRTHWAAIPPLPQPPVDPYAELKKAHAEGKVIQCVGAFGDWDEIERPVWNLEPCEYRIKPWELSRHLPGFRPLADREEWHRPENWKEDMLPIGYRPLLKGETIDRFDEYNPRTTNHACSDEWMKHSSAAGTQCVLNPNSRTTRPLPPTKKELEIQAFETWWTDYKLQAVARTPNRDTAFDAWKAARATNTDHEKA